MTGVANRDEMEVRRVAAAVAAVIAAALVVHDKVRPALRLLHLQRLYPSLRAHEAAVERHVAAVYHYATWQLLDDLRINRHNARPTFGIINITYEISYLFIVSNNPPPLPPHRLPLQTAQGLVLAVRTCSADVTDGELR